MTMLLMLLMLLLLSPVRADIMPPAPTGFVAEDPEPPRLPPHPFPVVAAGAGVLGILALGALLRHQAVRRREEAD